MVSLRLDICEEVSIQISRNGADVILAAELTNDDVPLQGITVWITAEPAFIKPCSARFELLAPSSVTDMCQSLVPELDLTYMASVRQSQKATVTLSVADQSGNILKSTSATTEILPYGYWPVQYMPESIAASVMPASACLEQVRKLMSDTLGHWGRGTELAGYAGDVNSVQDLGAAAFSALKRFNIAYSNPPEGFETSGYRIRLPEEVLGRREGNCLDMAVLYASVLESVGLNTVLFVSKGYVFAGFWLVDDHMSDIICTDASRFTRQIRSGDMRAVDCAMFAAGSSQDFTVAADAALSILEGNDLFSYAVDIAAARITVPPLPTREELTAAALGEPVTAPDAVGKTVDDVLPG